MYDLVKDIKEIPIANSISEDEFNGKKFAKLIKSSLLERNKNLRIEVNLNPWDLAKAIHRNEWEIIDEYGVLQPDIDILCCEKGNTFQLTGVEIKVFRLRYRRTRDIRKSLLLPRAEGKGYYAGLEQALALLAYGLDMAYLWHVFLIPYEALKDYDKPKLFDIFANNVGRYSDTILKIIEHLNLPIGYLSSGIIIDNVGKRIRHIFLEEKSRKAKHNKHNPFLQFGLAWKRRNLIVKKISGSQKS